MVTLGLRVLAWSTVAWLAFQGQALRAWGTELAFDLPDMIECRDATPPGFAEAHSGLKVVEGKFRISARVVDGKLSDVVDFLYVLTSEDRTLRLQDYLPNTTLESTVLDDQIEITDSSEKATSGGLDAHVVYKPVTAGGTIGASSKNCESSKYKQIAPRELVLAAGTINREHGVFFRLQQSRAASLEGAKEFSFLATVPATWRGDLCVINCAARAKKSSLVSSSVIPAGNCRAQVALYLVGDAESAGLAEKLRVAQETHARLASAPKPKENVLEAISTQATRLLWVKKSAADRDRELRDAERAVAEAQSELRRLAR
ncbi:MAG TPA: hypothetical protein VGJ16_07555 [Pirellulales bacterium]